MKSMMAFALLFAATLPLRVVAAALYDHAPPGDVVQTANLNFGGNNTGALYAAVVSRKLLTGKAASAHPQYQPYLTIYRQNSQTGALTQVYQSPGVGDNLKLVPQRAAIANASSLWLPGVELTIVGAGSLMQPDAQQLVVEVYEFAADCGQVTLHVLRLDATTQKFQDTLQVQNPCKLDGALSGRSVILTGPYYAKSAALCCPTKNNARSNLSFDLAARRWIITPSYFKLLAETPSSAATSAGANVSAHGSKTQTSSSVLYASLGQSFSITLPSNRSSGYMWEIIGATVGPGMKPLDSKYRAANSPLMGAPGQQVWRFRPVMKGYSLIGLRYVRPFDPHAAPAKEAYYVIVTR